MAVLESYFIQRDKINKRIEVNFYLRVDYCVQPSADRAAGREELQQEDEPAASL
jgi:hypothetical protein